MSFKIVVIGPESTGKSYLCRSLAEHYHTSWVPEYAREYLLKNGKDYTQSDLFEIGKGQLRSEDSVADMPGPLFIDTDMYVIKVWSEFVFNKCDNRILDQIAKRKYQLYLLCNTDLPWEMDELREYPDVKIREKLYHFYKDAMVNQHIPWVDISGNYKERLQKSIAAIDLLLKNNKP